MSNIEEKSVPLYVFESTQARADRRDKRNAIALVIVVIALLISNLAWLWAWTQYDYTSETYTYEQDGEGLNNLNTGTQGAINYGAEADH